MQIALTKKLSTAMGIKPANGDETIDPLFSWTANYVKTWANSRSEDMLVLVNNATRFVVAIYEFKRKDLKKAATIIPSAIKNTLLGMNLNPEIVDEYMRLAGEVQFTANRSPKYTAWVNKAGIDCVYYVEETYNGMPKMFCDTIGIVMNNSFVDFSKSMKAAFRPKDKFFDALSELTGKPKYKYRAFEIKVTLDLEIYKATRRLIVPADITLEKLHDVLQKAFGWEDSHLHGWRVFDNAGNKRIIHIVMREEDLRYDESATIETGYKLSEYFPKFKYILYTYDFGDSWEHLIELVRTIENYDAESPYLLEAIGQTPPDDVGGVPGFIDFRAIMLNPDHVDYEETKEWAGLWKPELSEWDKKPHVIAEWW